MIQETQDSTNGLNVVDTVFEAANSILAHDRFFGTEYTTTEGYLAPEEVKRLKEQIAKKIRQIFRILFDEKGQPFLHNPKNPIETSVMIKDFGVEEIVEKMSTVNRVELTPLIEELKKMGAKIGDDTARLSNDPISIEALPTGGDDLIEP